MKILVTGASGLVGNLIARRLAFEKHQVHALARTTESASLVQDVAAKIEIADLTLPATLEKTLGEVETIIH